MTSELRPAVETRAEVLDQLLSELQDGNAWDSTISLLADYADLVQDLLKDRETVRAEQTAELAKFKALAETLAGELQQIEVDAMEYYNEWCETGCDQKDAIRFAFGLGEETRKALRQYKETRDD